MGTSLSNLTNNLSEINKNELKKCKENCKYIKCKKCNNKSYKSIDALKIKLPNTYQFCNNDNNKFLLLLRKGVYPCKYMDNWERFNKTMLPPKKIILQ